MLCAVASTAPTAITTGPRVGAIYVIISCAVGTYANMYRRGSHVLGTVKMRHRECHAYGDIVTSVPWVGVYVVLTGQIIDQSR